MSQNTNPSDTKYISAIIQAVKKKDPQLYNHLFPGYVVGPVKYFYVTNTPDRVLITHLPKKDQSSALSVLNALKNANISTETLTDVVGAAIYGRNLVTSAATTAEKIYQTPGAKEGYKQYLNGISPSGGKRKTTTKRKTKKVRKYK
jgi:hypothetical protein